MHFRILLLLQVAVAVRDHEVDLDQLSLDESMDEPKLDKLSKAISTVAKAFNHETPVTITFADEPHINIVQFFNTTWTAVPMTQNKGDLVIAGGVYNIIKLLRSRNLLISCPVLWAQHGWEAYMSITHPAQKASAVLTGLVTKGLIDVANIGHLKDVLAKMMGMTDFQYPASMLAAGAKILEAGTSEMGMLNSSTMHHAEAVRSSGTEVDDTAGQNSTKFHQVVDAVAALLSEVKLPEAKLQVLRAKDTKRVVRLMLGAKYTEEGAYDLRMRCMQPDPQKSPFVYIPNPNGPIPLKTQLLAGFILALS
ncbi:unnamed protein product [Symbiodinium sp. CCMP2456]|nr:unnamed protein product [Symbiodinium sp. CCMP2456]